MISQIKTRTTTIVRTREQQKKRPPNPMRTMIMTGRLVLFFSLLASPIRVSASDSVGTFAWLSDAHFDHFYGSPSAEVHKTGAPCAQADAPPFSAYGCGSSLPLVEAAVKTAAEVSDDLDFVLFTGDSARHDAQNGAVVLDAISKVQGLFEKYFPDTQIIELPAMDLGNNDLMGDYYLNVTSHKPCLPGDDGSLPVATNKWLQVVAEQQSYSFTTDLEKATFACGGYLNRKVNEDLHIIVLNTIIWCLKHTPVATGLDAADPFGQFEWLVKQLSDLRDAGKKVYITGHVPPMLQSFTGSEGEPLSPMSVQSDFPRHGYFPAIQDRYFDLANEYVDVIAGMMFAHVHSNELRHVASFPDDVPPMIVSGSIAPCYTTNPTFSIVKYDRGVTMYPIDIITYNVDLSVDHPANSTDPFVKTFDSVTEYLGMKSLTNAETLKLASRMLPGTGFTDDEVWNRYFQHWYKGTPQNCDATCQRGEACLVACGYKDTIWGACNSSTGDLSIEEACGFNDDNDDDTSLAQDYPTPSWMGFAFVFAACAFTFAFP